MRWYFVIHLPFLSYAGMAIYPFIFVKKKHYAKDKYIMNHEKIHLIQQLEMLILPFYVAYIGHYLWNLAYYRNHNEAYRNIIFEREAYYCDADLDYLKKRRFWAFLWH